MKCKNVIIAGFIILTLLCAATVFGMGNKEKDTIKVGAILSVTGGGAFLGGPEAKTLEMLVEEINNTGGVDGRKIEVIIKDSQGSTENAISFAKQLIEEEKVLAIIGPSTSGESINIKSICEEGQTILLSCAAAEDIVNPVASYIFKTPQKDSYAAMKIFETMNKMGITDIGIVVGNTGFGKGGKAQLEKYAPDYGINIKIAEVYEASATDLTSVLTKLNNAGIQAVVNWSIVPAQSIIPKNMKQLGMSQPLFQSHGFGNIKYVEAAGEAAEGIIFPCGRLLVADVLPSNHPQKAVLVKYKNDYESKFKEDASTFGGHAYDALMILIDVIKKVKSTDKAKVREAIENLKNFVGTGGVFNFSASDHNGLAIDSFEMLTVKNGKFMLLY
ncbi:MAG: ABC transporter substrate-binding protein [Spirochaetales bacterium]|nr:ABC transporter substrate-binding protein [Spirochaetales bacterium]